MEVLIGCYRQTEGEEFVLVKGRRLKETGLATDFLVFLHDYKDESQNILVALSAINASLVPFLIDLSVEVGMKDLYTGENMFIRVPLVKPFMFKPDQQFKAEIGLDTIVEAIHRTLVRMEFDPCELEISHLGALRISIVLSDDSYRALLTINSVDALVTNTNFNLN